MTCRSPELLAPPSIAGFFGIGYGPLSLSGRVLEGDLDLGLRRRNGGDRNADRCALIQTRPEIGVDAGGRRRCSPRRSPTSRGPADARRRPATRCRTAGSSSHERPAGWPRWARATEWPIATVSETASRSASRRPGAAPAWRRALRRPCWGCSVGLEQPAASTITAVATRESRARRRTRAFCAGRRGGSTARRIPVVRRYGVKSRV